MLASGFGTAKPNSEFINGIYGNSIDVTDVAATVTVIYFGIAPFLNAPVRLSVTTRHIAPVITVRSVSITDETCCADITPPARVRNRADIAPQISPQTALLIKNFLSGFPCEMKPDGVILPLISDFTFLKPVQQRGITAAVRTAASIGVIIPYPVIISAREVQANAISVDRRINIQRLMFL